MIEEKFNMETKNFNRKILRRILYAVSAVALLLSAALVAYTMASGYWHGGVGAALLFLMGALLTAMGAVNMDDDEITVDYVKKEIRSKIKFDPDQWICVSFASVTGVYVYNADQLKRELKLKKYPPKTLVIEKPSGKVYISLKFFDEATVRDLLKEIRKARETV